MASYLWHNDRLVDGTPQPGGLSPQQLGSVLPVVKHCLKRLDLLRWVYEEVHGDGSKLDLSDFPCLIELATQHALFLSGDVLLIDGADVSRKLNGLENLLPSSLQVLRVSSP